ncbi:hypothetical protein ACSSS7_005238 [Eimeria intestinalis]
MSQQGAKRQGARACQSDRPLKRRKAQKRSSFSVSAAAQPSAQAKANAGSQPEAAERFCTVSGEECDDFPLGSPAEVCGSAPEVVPVVPPAPEAVPPSIKPTRPDSTSGAQEPSAVAPAPASATLVQIRKKQAAVQTVSEMLQGLGNSKSFPAHLEQLQPTSLHGRVQLIPEPLKCRDICSLLLGEGRKGTKPPSTCSYAGGSCGDCGVGGAGTIRRAWMYAGRTTSVLAKGHPVVKCRGVSAAFATSTTPAGTCVGTLRPRGSQSAAMRNGRQARQRVCWGWPPTAEPRGSRLWRVGCGGIGGIREGELLGQGRPWKSQTAFACAIGEILDVPGHWSGGQGSLARQNCEEEAAMKPSGAGEIITKEGGQKTSARQLPHFAGRSGSRWQASAKPRTCDAHDRGRRKRNKDLAREAANGVARTGGERGREDAVAEAVRRARLVADVGGNVFRQARMQLLHSDMEGVNRAIESLKGELNSLQGRPQVRIIARDRVEAGRRSRIPRRRWGRSEFRGGVGSGRGRGKGERKPSKGAGRIKAAEEAAERIGERERERSARSAAAVRRARRGRGRARRATASGVMEEVLGDRLRFKEAGGVASMTRRVGAMRVAGGTEGGLASVLVCCRPGARPAQPARGSAQRPAAAPSAKPGTKLATHQAGLSPAPFFRRGLAALVLLNNLKEAMKCYSSYFKARRYTPRPGAPALRRSGARGAPPT